MTTEAEKPLYPPLASHRTPFHPGDTVYRAWYRMGCVAVEKATVQAVRGSVVRLTERPGLAFDCKKDVPNDRRLGHTSDEAIRGLIEEELRGIAACEARIAEHRRWIAECEAAL